MYHSFIHHTKYIMAPPKQQVTKLIEKHMERYLAANRGKHTALKQQVLEIHQAVFVEVARLVQQTGVHLKMYKLDVGSSSSLVKSCKLYKRIENCILRLVHSSIRTVASIRWLWLMVEAGLDWGGGVEGGRGWWWWGWGCRGHSHHKIHRMEMRLIVFETKRKYIEWERG